jgi:hypothetical protein
VKDIWMYRIDDASGSHRHVCKEKCQQNHAETDAAEKVKDWSDQGVHCVLGLRDAGELRD